MALAKDVIQPGDEEVLNRLGFKVDVGYIEVPRCEDCKYWRGMRGYGGECLRSLNARIPEPSMMWASDNEGDRVPVFTQHSFGCIQFESKEIDK